MMRPRFEPQPRTRVVTAEQVSQGFVVARMDCQTGEMLYMSVSYARLVAYGDGRFLVVDPVWRNYL